jgi:RNA polymerase sigma factor (sigma-70 family)
MGRHRTRAWTTRLPNRLADSGTRPGLRRCPARGVYRNPQSVRRGEDWQPQAFLNRLVTFRALDALRRRKRLGSVDPSTFVDESLGPLERAIEHEDDMRLRAIVAELPPRQAAVFCMTHFEELSHEEIADLLEISTNAVAMAVRKARATLREMMFKIHQEQES